MFTPPSATRATRLLTVAAPFLIAALVYVGFAVRTETLLQGDQPHYALEAFSIGDDGDRDLSDDVRDLALVDKVWDQATFAPQAAHYYAGGPLVSWHAPGVAFLLAPAARVGGSVEAMQIELALIAALGAALLFSILARLVPGRAWLRWVVWGGVVFALPVLGFANQLFPDLPAAVLVLAVVRLMLARRVGVPAVLVASLCAAALPWFHVRYWPVAVALELGIAVRVFGVQRGRTRIFALAVIASALLASFALTAVANQAWYGSSSLTAGQRTPVHRVVSSAASDAGAQADSAATVNIGDTIDASWDRVYRGFGRSLFSGRSGWLPYAPIALLGIAAALAIRGNWWMAYGVVVAGGYLLSLALSGTLPGYVIPGRFEVILAPLVAIPLVMAADRLRGLRVAIVPLAVLGVVLGFGGRMHIGALYPPADPTAKPAISGLSWLVAPWPSVTRSQSASIAPVTIAPERGGASVVSAPAGRRGVVADAAPPEPISGDQVVVAALARDGSAPAGRPVADVALVVDGVTAVHHLVTAGELPGDGAFRGIPLQVRLHEGQRLRIVVRSTGAVALRVGDMQASGPSLSDTGLAQDGTRYPDWLWVAGWTTVLAALTAAIALGLRRPLAPPHERVPETRPYAAQPCTSVST